MGQWTGLCIRVQEQPGQPMEGPVLQKVVSPVKNKLLI